MGSEHAGHALPWFERKHGNEGGASNDAFNAQIRCRARSCADQKCLENERNASCALIAGQRLQQITLCKQRQTRIAQRLRMHEVNRSSARRRSTHRPEGLMLTPDW